MRKILIPGLTAALVIAAMLYQARTVDPVLCEAPDVKLAEIDGWRSEPVEVSEAERHVLPDDTGFDKRRYEDEVGNWFQVSMVIGGRSKSSIHRPGAGLPDDGAAHDGVRRRRVASRDAGARGGAGLRVCVYVLQSGRVPHVFASEAHLPGRMGQEHSGAD